MNKIVREYYPVSRLPEDLREGLISDAQVIVTVEQVEPRPNRVMTLDEIFAAAGHLIEAPRKSTPKFVCKETNGMTEATGLS